MNEIVGLLEEKKLSSRRERFEKVLNIDNNTLKVVKQLVRYKSMEEREKTIQEVLEEKELKDDKEINRLREKSF